MKTKPFSYLPLLLLFAGISTAKGEVKLPNMNIGAKHFLTPGSDYGVANNPYNSFLLLPGWLRQFHHPGFSTQYFFDENKEHSFIPNSIPPVIQSATAIGVNALDVLFNEPLDITSSQLSANYVADNLLGAAANAVLDASNKAMVHLTFAGNFTSGYHYQLTVNGVKNLSGNAISNGIVTFIYLPAYIPRQYDIVIDEIMADPAPPVSLPNNEWIELRNTSSSPVNLQSWRIGDSNGQSGPLPNFILMPDSFVVVGSSSTVASMAVYGNAVAVTGFPSLDNTADQLYLRSPQSTMIHSVSYTDNWYQNELKKEGGWTLEMIDTKSPCSGINNWKASNDLKGGTPGKKNSLDGVNPDINAPKLLRAYPIDSITVILVFDEPLDSTKASLSNNFNINNGIGIPAGVVVMAPSFNRVTLKLNAALINNQVYKVTVTGINDCVGNVIGKINSANVGLPEVAAFQDIVINEILFNPPSNGTDYVEIYNRSKKIIDCKQVYIASRNSSGIVSSIYRLSAENYLLFPQEFMVVTENAATVKAAYITQNTEAFLEINNLPSFNDDKGTVIILNVQGEVTDELAYQENWHFKLITNREGVALERIDYNAPTQSPENWHSAATSVGYGTPTYKNSQFRINEGVQGNVTSTPEIVSPDNDGQDDFAMVGYHFPEPGYVANITIFDASGRPVRYLQRNALCGTNGSFRWDGLGEQSRQLATGVYILFTEVFNLKGNRKQFKNVIVVARRN